MQGGKRPYGEQLMSKKNEGIRKFEITVRLIMDATLNPSTGKIDRKSASQEESFLTDSPYGRLCRFLTFFITPFSYNWNINHGKNC